MTTQKKSWLHKIKKTLQQLKKKPRTKEQLASDLREAEQHAVLDMDTLLMMESVLELADMKVRSIMIPRSHMVTIPVDAEWEKIIHIVHASGHSRFPVIDDTAHRQEILGILHAKNLLLCQLSDAKKFDLKDILKPVTFVPESKRLDILLKEFRRTRNHMAIVVDEYGNTSGFVTIEDIIEQVVGDIEDEFDIDGDVHIKKHSDKKYILKAQMPIESFNEYFSTDFETDECDTIGGMMLKKLAHMPQKGEKIQVGNYHFKVISADSRKIKLLQLVIQKT